MIGTRVTWTSRWNEDGVTHETEHTGKVLAVASSAGLYGPRWVALVACYENGTILEKNPLELRCPDLVARPRERPAPTSIPGDGTSSRPGRGKPKT